MLEKIARKIGVGAELALGTKELSCGTAKNLQCNQRIGVPGYEPRGSGQWIGLCRCRSGACHMRAYPIASEVYEGTADPYTGEGKAKLVYTVKCIMR